MGRLPVEPLACEAAVADASAAAAKLQAAFALAAARALRSAVPSRSVCLPYGRSTKSLAMLKFKLAQTAHPKRCVAMGTKSACWEIWSCHMTVFTPIAGRMSAPRHHIQTLAKQRWEITGSPELSKLLGDRANCKEGEAEILRAPVLFELLQRRPSARTRPAASPSTHWRAPGINDRAIADAACGRSAPPKEGDTQCSTCLSQNPVREAALA